MNNPIDNASMADSQELLKNASTDFNTGLTRKEAEKRLSIYGKNVLKAGEKVSLLKILFHNINNIIVYLLIAASVVSFVMSETIEGFAVIIAILIAVLSGFITEYKAQKSVESLQKLTKSKAKVRRGSEISEIPSEQLVPGDILFIEEGDLITADGRIIESRNFAAIESALTGESETSEKDSGFLGEEDTPIGDRKNMVFTGTAASRGNAYILVTATGMATEIGRISGLISSEDSSPSPLETQLGHLGKTLIIFAGIVALAVIFLGLLYGRDLYMMIKIGIILAIAAVPEALPAVSTITLAIGMKTMARHNALVKSLPAVETLGSTTVICTDKTGTLTENQMTVRSVYLSSKGETYEVKGDGYIPQGEIVGAPDELDELIICGVLCSNASLVKEEEEYKVIGDPTEGGIIVLGEKASITKSGLEKKGFRRLGEVPFNSNDKYMVTAYETPEKKNRIYIKGAPHVLLEMSHANKDKTEEWARISEEMAGNGMRVLALAQAEYHQADGSDESMKEALTKGIDILGLIGILDPPRADVKNAVHEAQTAGIRIIMITGDHPKTARNIAEKIGMDNTSGVITGKEMDRMSEEELAREIKSVSIFARVSPENKLQIVRALNLDNEVTAMTGDGVNDAPALNGADIGISMGIRGTEVARDASDMILTDDRFSTIVKAVREGRIIFDNIEKFVYFLFSCNVVEILAVFLSILLKLPMPILALQILWLNLVVDILPAMSLAWEPGEKNIMARKPRNPEQAIISKSFLFKIMISGALIGLSSLGVFAFGLSLNYSVDTARTMAFAAMAFGQLFHLFTVREKNNFGFDKSLIKNPFLIGSFVISSLLVFAAVHIPPLNRVMETVPLNGFRWMIVLAGSAVPTAILQIIRLVSLAVKKRKAA